MSVALRGLGNNAINGGIDKRFKSPAFHAGVTGSNPVAVTIKIGTANYISYGIVNPRVVSSSLTRSAYGATVAQLVEQVKNEKPILYFGEWWNWQTQGT